MVGCSGGPLADRSEDGVWGLVEVGVNSDESRVLGVKGCYCDLLHLLYTLADCGGHGVLGLVEVGGEQR